MLTDDSSRCIAGCTTCLPLSAAGGFAEITHFQSENIVEFLTKKENDQKKKRTSTNKQELICDLKIIQPNLEKK